MIADGAGAAGVGVLRNGMGVAGLSGRLMLSAGVGMCRALCGGGGEPNAERAKACGEVSEERAGKLGNAGFGENG